MLQTFILGAHHQRKMKINQKTRLPQPQRMAAVAVLVTFGCFLYLDSRHEIFCSTVKFVHLASFAFHFGSQLWVTFVSGLLMYYTLPRIMFGRLQSRIFPLFFLISLVSSTTVLVTFVYLNWSAHFYRQHLQQLLVLLLNVLLAMAGIQKIAPMTVRCMERKFQLERQGGIAFLVGPVNLEDLKKNPEFARIQNLFRQCHCLCSLTNMAIMAMNTVYLYYLSQKLLVSYTVI